MYRRNCDLTTAKGTQKTRQYGAAKATPSVRNYFTAMTALPVRKYSVPLAIAGVAIA